MPRLVFQQNFRRPAAEVFAFFRRPASRLRLAPPELGLQLVEAPEQLELGSRITLRGRRAGVTQHLVSAVTQFEPGRSFVEEQQQGPFRRWVHSYCFEAQEDGGTLVTEEIDFEPPGGVLGLLHTAAKI